MSLCIKFTDRESECRFSPLSPELLLPLLQLPGHTFLSSSLAMLLLQPNQDYMHLSALKTGWHPTADSIFSCSQYPAALMESNCGDVSAWSLLCIWPLALLQHCCLEVLLTALHETPNTVHSMKRRQLNIYIVWL